jgi:hypothetical protein
VRVRLELDRPELVLASVSISEEQSGSAAVVIRLRALRVELDRTGEILDGARRYPRPHRGDAAVVVHLSVARRQLERAGKVGAGAIEVSEAGAGGAPVGVRRRQARLLPDCLVEGGERVGVAPGLVGGEPAVERRGGRAGCQEQAHSERSRPRQRSQRSIVHARNDNRA